MKQIYNCALSHLSLQQQLDKAEVKPKLLYINPTGANPTGTLLPLARRKEIYKLASQHDLLILEDDPYFYLQVLLYFKEEQSLKGTKLNFSCLCVVAVHWQ